MTARAAKEALFNGTVAWANNDAIGTEQDIDITLAAEREGDEKYFIGVTNPSTETAIDVIPKAVIDDGGTPRRPPVQTATFQIPVNKPEGEGAVVESFFFGTSGRVTLSNPTVIGAGGAFTARVEIWRL